MIVIIHGYGKTDVAGRTSYYDLAQPVHPTRDLDVDMGQARVAAKAKGRSTPIKPVESSAREVLDAIRHARESKLPGHKRSTLGHQPRRMDRATGDHARSQNLRSGFR